LVARNDINVTTFSAFAKDIEGATYCHQQNFSPDVHVIADRRAEIDG
jgi:hypothetical protein